MSRRKSSNRRAVATRDFDSRVSKLVAAFTRDFDPKRERCWIEEVDGANVGCALLRQRAPKTAHLELLVERGAGGKSAGAKLTEVATRFARGAGYRKLIFKRRTLAL